VNGWRCDDDDHVLAQAMSRKLPLHGHLSTHQMNTYSFGWTFNTRQRQLVIFLGGLSVLVIFWLLNGENELQQQQDIYQRTPFCDPDGTCHEKPDQPSARTIYSARSKQQYDKWWRAHAILNQTAREFASHLQEEKQSGKRPLIMYGDSITESWIGTDMQYPKPRTVDIPQVLQETLLQPRYGLNILVAAIGGDQTQHLLYRMQHGELLPEFANDPSAVYVVLIGTNNLGAGEKPGPTAMGIQAVVNFLLEHTEGSMLLLKLLPRGANTRLAAPKEKSSLLSFMPDISLVNQKLDEYRETLPVSEKDGARNPRDRVKVVDCGQPFMNQDNNSKDSEEVMEALMPDRLHPNAEGHRILAQCILSGLEDGFDLFA
jgi:lysophospholipase L1-like esterase